MLILQAKKLNAMIPLEYNLVSLRQTIRYQKAQQHGLFLEALIAIRNDYRIPLS